MKNGAARKARARASDPNVKTSLSSLLDYACKRGDPYLAAALHPFAEAAARKKLEDISLANRKFRRLLAGAPYTPASLLEVLANRLRL
jgi:hypothetical protein